MLLCSGGQIVNLQFPSFPGSRIKAKPTIKAPSTTSYLLFFPVPDNDIALGLRRGRDKPLVVSRKTARNKVTLAREEHRSDALAVLHEIDGHLRSEQKGARGLAREQLKFVGRCGAYSRTLCNREKLPPARSRVRIRRKTPTLCC